MFCSTCGKTLDSSATQCPHCGAVLGESRMIGHTSVQPRVMPVTDNDSGASRYTPYTKTTYTSMEETEDDVYSRTAYRPVLVEKSEAVQSDEAQDEQSEQAEPSQPDGLIDGEAASDGGETDLAQTETAANIEFGSTGEATEIQKQAIERLTTVPDGAPSSDEAQRILEKELNLRVAPPKPIKKTGISPEVENYVARMEAMKDRGRKKRVAADDSEYVDEDTAETVISQEETGADKAAIRAARKAEKERNAALRPRGNVRKWVGRIASVVAILIVVVGGLLFLSQVLQEKSPVPGVSLSLYENGVKVLESRNTDAYREKYRKLYEQSTTNQDALNEEKVKDRAEIAALKPSAPQENDETFLSALNSIQDAVDAATLSYAMGMLTQDAAAKESARATANEQWSIVDNSIRRIAGAKDMVDVNAVFNAKEQVEEKAIPEATPEPTVVYKALSKGDKKQAVKDLQIRLYDLGYFTGLRDGKYGTVTQKSVKMFEQAHGLTVTGVASPEVQELLFSDDAIPNNQVRDTATPQVEQDPATPAEAE